MTDPVPLRGRDVVTVCLVHKDGDQRVDHLKVAAALKASGIDLAVIPTAPIGHVNVNGFTPAGRVDITRYTDAPEGGDCPDCKAHFPSRSTHECEVCAECKGPAPKSQPHGPCISVHLYDGHGLDKATLDRIPVILKAYKP